MTYVLGLDLGTGSLKGLLVNKNGEVVAQASQEYPLFHEKIGYSEQNPHDWYQACLMVMDELAEEVADFSELEGIAISGQMHGLVLLDKEGQVLRLAILWNDTRNSAQCRQLQTDLGQELVAITKNKALEGFTLPKILWVQEHELEIWEQVAQILLPKDYLGYCLTGQYFTDRSDASGTLLYDLNQNDWSEKILGKYAISRDLLPEVYQSTDIVGYLKQILQERYGFKKQISLSAGGADNACAAVGAGILDQGTAMISIGTSGVFLSYEDQAHDAYQGQLHLFHHGQSDAYYSMGVTLAAGHSLHWFKDTFAPQQSYQQLLEGIEKFSPGSDSLLFTPYIVGERTPYADSQIRGSFIGIDTHHTLKHFARSVLEGISFSLKDCQRLMEDLSQKQFDKIVSVGGGAKDPVWLQMQADIFGKPIVTLANEQGPGLGAAMMACVGAGWFSDLATASKRFVRYSQRLEPIQENVEQYKTIYKKYQKIYNATKGLLK